MYAGFHPQHQLDLVERRQAEIRAQARLDAETRRDSRSSRGRTPVAFRLGRLHVMLWFDGAHGAR